MCRRTPWVLLAIVLAVVWVAPAMGAKTSKVIPPKDLVDYVLEASRLGLREKDIHDNASKAGWPDALITQAIEAARQQIQPPPAPQPVPVQPPEQEPKESAPTTPAVSEAAAPRPQPKTPQMPPQQGPRPASFEPASNPFARTEPPQPLITQPASALGSMDDYRIGAGDVLQINVWDEPKASVPNAVVRTDGKISMPLIKEVEVLGLSPKQAEAVITERMSVLIPNVEVTVVVSAIHSKKIYAIGAVKKEGPIPYTYRMTVLQALSEAGGLNDYARRKKIYILRTQNGKEYRLPFDYDAVLKGERMELNLVMQPNDTLVVPR